MGGQLFARVERGVSIPSLRVAIFRLSDLKVCRREVNQVPLTVQ